LNELILFFTNGFGCSVDNGSFLWRRVLACVKHRACGLEHDYVVVMWFSFLLDDINLDAKAKTEPNIPSVYPAVVGGSPRHPLPFVQESERQKRAMIFPRICISLALSSSSHNWESSGIVLDLLLSFEISSGAAIGHATTGSEAQAPTQARCCCRHLC